MSFTKPLYIFICKFAVYQFLLKPIPKPLLFFPSYTFQFLLFFTDQTILEFKMY